MRKGGLIAIKVAIVLLVVWGVHRSLNAGFADLSRRKLEFHMGWLVAAALVYLVGLAPACAFWRNVMQAMGQPVRWIDVARAYFIGNLGKYVPGKAMVLILRTGLMKPSGVEMGVTAVSVFLETLTMMAVGALWAAIILFVGYPEQWKFGLVSLAMAIVCGAPTTPLFFRLAIRLTAIGKKFPGTVERVSGVSYRVLLGGWVAMTLSWALQGWSLWATLRAMGGAELDPLRDFPLCVACSAIAVVAGFLSFVPGGFVVRESVLVSLLAPHVGEGVALGSSLVLRLVWTISEVAISAVLVAIGARQTRPPREELVVE